MKKFIIKYRPILGVIAILAVTGFAVLGCGDTTDGTVTGPAAVSSCDQTIVGSTTSLGSEAPEAVSMVPAPDELCEIKRTGEVLFVSYNSKTAYLIMVGQQTAGILPPLGNLLITVPEGSVTWLAIPKTPGPAGDPQKGQLSVKRCARGRVNIDFHPDQIQPADPGW